MQWVQNNIGNLIVCSILLVVMGAIIVRMVKNKKEGKTSCGCGCGSCAISDSCHAKKKKSFRDPLIK